MPVLKSALMDEISELIGVARKVALARNNFQYRLVGSGAENSLFLPFLERVPREGVVITIQIEITDFKFNLRTLFIARPVRPRRPQRICP
jgi:hypothetical protein